MSNKVSLLLCMFFLLQFVIFCGDIIGYQLALSKAYTVTTYVNDYVSNKGVIDDEIQEYVSNSIHSSIVCTNSCSASSGASLDYSIQIAYTPILGILKEYAGDAVLSQRVYIK